MLKSLFLTSFVAVSTLLASSSLVHSQEENRQAIQHLQNKRFAEAIQILEANNDLNKQEFPADYLQLLKARAYLLSGQPEKAVTATQKLLKEFPKSKWQHKAKFLQAQALSDQKKHNEASAIYEAEANTLFSPEYKNKGAQLLLEIAATLSAEPTADDIDAPRPDLNKADNLLREAYEMDCTEELKETILAERIKLNTRKQNWKNVAKLSYIYLDRFDKQWRGKIGSLSRLTLEPTNKKAKLQGKNSFLVRFHLAEALHRSNDRLSASRYLREMISDLDKSNVENNQALLADATWLHLMATRESGGEPRDLEQWMVDAKAYLKRFPTHIHADSTVYTIAIIYQQEAKHKLAIEAYQHFLDNHYQLKIAADPLTFRPESKTEFADRQDKNKKRKEEVSYRIGKIYLAMDEFEKAQQAWNLSSKNFPNGSRWADCQRGLVDIQFKQTLYAVSKIATSEEAQKPEMRKQASESLLAFISKQPLDSRVPTVLYLIGNIHFQHALSFDTAIKESPTDELKTQQTTAFKDTIKSWEKLISSYPRSDHAKEANYLTARIYEDRFKDLDKALSIYKSIRHDDAKNRIATLTLEKLVSFNDKTFTTDQKPFITLNSRNVENVTVRQYWLDVESYFRKGRRLEDISSLDIDLVEADKTWELKLPNYKKHHFLESKVDIPFPSNKPGICIVKIESKNFSTTTMVMRSDIDISLRSSSNPRSNANELLAYIYNAKTKSPAKDIKLLIADGGQVITTGTTDANGVFHSTDKLLSEIKDLRILALSPSGAATCSAVNHSGQNFIQSQAVAATSKSAHKFKAFFNLPKDTFSPGEALPISGIVRFSKSGTHILPNKDQQSYTLTIRQDKKLLNKAKIELNEHGVFNYDYILPSRLKETSINLTLKPNFDDELRETSRLVIISKDNPDKVILELKMKKQWVAKDEKIEGTVTASYRWGAPYANKEVKINLPDDMQIKLITDDNGVATFSYDPQFFDSGYELNFYATIQNDDYYSNDTIVLVDPISFVILAKTDRTYVAAGDPVNIQIQTLNPDRSATSQEILIEVLRYKDYYADPILSSCKSLEDVSSSYSKEIFIEKTTLSTDPKTGQINHTFIPKKSGRFFIRLTGTDAKGRQVYAESSITAHDADSEQPLIMHALPEEQISKAGNTTNIETWSYFKSPATALLTVEISSIVEKRIITLQPGKNIIPIALEAQHCPVARIHLTLIKNRELYTAEQSIEVENKIDIIATITEINRDKGLALKLKLQALDSNKKPIAADYFLNLRESHDSPYLRPQRFFNTYSVLSYANTSSCGLLHNGTQQAIRTDVRDELARLNQSESDSIRRYNNQILNPAVLNRGRDQVRAIARRSNYRNNSNDDPFEDSQSVQGNGLRFYRPSSPSFRGNGTFIGGYEPPELPNSVEVGGGLNGGLRFREQFQVFPITPATPNAFAQFNKIDLAWTRLEHIPAEGKEIIITAEEAIAAGYKLQILGFGNDGSHGTVELDIAPADYQIASNAPSTAIKGDKWTPSFTMTREDTDKEQSIEANVTIYSDKTKHTFNFKVGDKTATLTLDQINLEEHVNYSISTEFAVLDNSFSARPKGIPSSKKTDRKLAKGQHKFNDSEAHTSTAIILDDITRLVETATLTPIRSSYGHSTPLHESHSAGQLMASTSYLQFLIDHKLQPERQAQLRKVISGTCADLTLSIKNDYGWSEVKNRRESSLLHSATAYQALVMADKLKIDFEKSTLKLALMHLQAKQKDLPIEHYNSRALVQFALAFSGDADFAVCNRLYREREKMDNIGKTILANAFILLDRKEFAVNLLKEIKNDNTVRIPDEQFLNSPALLDALISQAKSETDPAKVNNHTLTTKFNSAIDRGFSMRSYVARFKNKPIKVLPNNVKMGEKMEKFEVKEDFAYITEIETDFKEAKEMPRQADFYISDRKYYSTAPSYNGKPLRAAGSSEVKTLAIGETVKVILEGKNSNKNYPDCVIIEELPAGFDYLSGSLRGNHSGARKEGNHLIITYGSIPNKYKLSYTLIASRPGTWNHRQTILTPTYNIAKQVYNKADVLTVLENGKKSNNPYKLNATEHYELAKLNFNDNNYQAAKKHIIAYRTQKKTTEDPALAQMLLWIETASPQPDAQLLADSFEVLTERNPDLVIPFDKILKVGKAYRGLGEFERSKDVYTATLESGFNADSYVGAALEDQGKFMLSIDYQDKLWLLYPDLGEVTNSRFALGQQIYAKTSVAKTLGTNPETKKPYTEKEISTLSLGYMQDFITHAPTHTLASDAAFSIANALFALKRYQDVVEHTKQAAITYKDSQHSTSFRYMEALGHFWLRNYKQALASASIVAKGNSEDKNLASFITAQIYHANNQPEKAIEWYKGIKDSYPDAKQSIAYFEQKSISLDEVKILNSGDKAKIKLKYRNIKEAQFQIYRVDLMKLYLREKNLSNISKINLAGINPKHTLTVKLGDGKDFKEVEKEITLPLAKDGAYLVICRGDYIHTSGLVLITPLKMDVQEYPRNNSVRVNITDKKTGKFLDSVHVKAVGQNRTDIKSGETDLRGVWQGDSIASPTTIIARDKDGRYAFFRSKLAFNPRSNRQEERLNNKPKVDFNRNLNQKQDALQKKNLYNYEEKRRSKGKGVEIKKAWKK